MRRRLHRDIFVPAARGRRAHIVLALASLFAANAGCLADSQIPTPVLGAEAGELSCSARYPLQDDAASGGGSISFGSEGVTQSTNPWGAGPRFHLAFTFHNSSGAPVHFNPASVRLKDALGVDLRLVEVKRGDTAVGETTIDSGDEATIDLFFAGLGLKVTPQRMTHFRVEWPYGVGDSWWTRVTRCRQTAEPPEGNDGFGPWVSVEDPKDAATQRAQPRAKPPAPVGWPLHYTR